MGAVRGGLGRRMLLVDDDLSVRRALRMVLEQRGWGIAEAGSGADARQILGGGGIAAVVLDLTLGEEDGLEICRTLRESFAAAMPPVVIVSGRSDAWTRQEAVAAGAAEFLAKPFAMQALLEVLERVVDGARDGAGPDR